ncbi:MAG: BioY family protein [Methanoregula sp. PtaU1.Bin051]|nr:MAG: BioY family protein [Methanoregula sp. PtaU1.Bin051]
MFGDIRKTRLIAFSAAFIGLICLASWISIPFFPVPLTLQTLFVLLTAIVMHRYAAIPVALYVLLGALGLPIFHNGLAGVGVLLGPTGGYLIGFIFAALIAGIAFENSSKTSRIAGLAGATLAIYCCGITWLMISTGMEFLPSIMIGMLPFVPGDIVKAYAAYEISKRLP